MVRLSWLSRFYCPERGLDRSFYALVLFSLLMLVFDLGDGLVLLGLAYGVWWLESGVYRRRKVLTRTLGDDDLGEG